MARTVEIGIQDINEIIEKNYFYIDKTEFIKEWWENGETVPNTDTLKLLSRVFDVSINTLLGEPRQLICQCCGMPLDDSTISKEPNGDFNEEYCKWCYTDGEFKYTSKEQLIDFCVEHMANENWSAEQVRAHMEAVVPKLNHWK